MSLTYSGGHNALVVIRIDTYTVALQIKRILTIFYMFQFILVKIWPPPETGVDDVRETLPASHL